MHECLYACRHACIHVHRWAWNGLHRNRRALALGTMKMGLWTNWCGLEKGTFLPLQSRSKKLIRSEGTETSGCPLMELRSLMILHPPPDSTGPENIERKIINSNNDPNKHRKKGQAKQSQESLFLSVACTLVVIVSCACGTVVSSRSCSPCIHVCLVDVTLSPSGGSFSKTASTLAVLALVNVLASRASLFTSAP